MNKSKDRVECFEMNSVSISLDTDTAYIQKKKKKSDSLAFIALPEKTKAKFLSLLGLSYLQTLREIIGASIYDILSRKSDSS